MRRRRGLVVALSLFTLIVLPCGVRSARQPNILFILADDLGYNDVDWKDTRLHTPNLRSLAFSKNTVQLANSYVNQLCTPTRSALMTGYYPFRLGTQNGVFLHLEPSGVPLIFPFVPQNLKSIGYKTYMIGKWHLGYCRKELLPTERGFDYFYGYYGPQAGSLRRVVSGLDLFREREPGVSVPDFTKDGTYSSDLFASETIRTLESHDPDRPFFTFLSFQSVHPPLQVPKYYDQFCPAFAPRSNRRIYCGMLAAMDDAVGKVVTFLQEKGLYDNTVIIFSSDNGGGVEFGASNYPLRGEKDTLWEGGTKTNTFIHAPGHISQFSVRQELFHVIDWHATLLGIGGLDIKAYGDGINQWEYIRTGVPRIRRYQFIYNIDHRGSAIREGEYKLIYGSTGSVLRKHSAEAGRRRTRLFRITRDPSESNDIAWSHPHIVSRLKSKLLSLSQYMRKSVRVPLNLWGSPERHNGTYASGWCE